MNVRKKNILLLAAMAMIMVSCSKKIHPANKVTEKYPRHNTGPARGETSDNPPSINNPPESATVPLPVAPAMLSPMIVIDEKGTIITSREKLPENIAAKVDYKKISRSFTPSQRQNLIFRFKMVPPRVLFIPDQLASKTARGVYTVYKKKFWYWKKEDGLFYLDETYYK